jgi:hypothetical protein
LWGFRQRKRPRRLGRRGQVLALRKGEGSPPATQAIRGAGHGSCERHEKFRLCPFSNGVRQQGNSYRPKQKAPPRTGPDSSLEVFGSRRKPLPSACQTNSARADAFQSAFRAFSEVAPYGSPNVPANTRDRSAQHAEDMEIDRRPGARGCPSKNGHTTSSLENMPRGWSGATIASIGTRFRPGGLKFFLGLPDFWDTPVGY